MAYDWRGGHIAITETNGFQIQLVTYNEQGRGSLLDLAMDMILEKPQELVFDAEARLVAVYVRESM